MDKIFRYFGQNISDFFSLFSYIWRSYLKKCIANFEKSSCFVKISIIFSKNYLFQTPNLQTKGEIDIFSCIGDEISAEKNFSKNIGRFYSSDTESFECFWFRSKACPKLKTSEIFGIQCILLFFCTNSSTKDAFLDYDTT